MKNNLKTRINNKLNILLYNDSASAPILAEKISKSYRINKFYIAGHNNFIKQYGIPLEVDGNNLVNFAVNNNIDIFICDSEINITGITSAFIKNGIPSLGITQKWARLEASKEFGKHFASSFDIPVPKYVICNSLEEFNENIKSFMYPFVIKSDGYSKGLGTYIVRNYKEACDALNKINDIIRDNELKIIIEEYIEGEELSDIVIWNGKKIIPICAVKDYKKVSKNSLINTASMGAYYAPNIVDNNKKIILENYHKKLEKILQNLKANFTGPIYSGLIFSKEKFYLLEYNMRFGTTESSIIFSNLNCDIIDFIEGTVKGTISKCPFDTSNEIASVILYAKGYPFDKTSKSIINFDTLDKIKEKNIDIFLNKVDIKDRDCIIDCNSFIYLVYKGINPSEHIINTLKDLNLNNVLYREDIGS